MMKRYYAEGVMSRHAAELFKRNRHDWKKLRDKKVLVAGAGGLGSFVLAELVGSGVGEVHVVDPDVVEPHNLNRQFWYTVEDVGRPKVEVIAERLGGRGATVIGIRGRVEEVDITGYDVVLDCMDDWRSKIDLLSRASREGIPVVFMSVGDGRGLVSVPSGPLRFEAPRGRRVSTPEIAVASGIGIEEAIRLLSGEEPLLRNKLLVFDLELFTFQVFDLE